MKTRIIDETLRDDLTGTQLANAINDAIKQWEGERFMFNEKRYQILTVASQEYYDLISPTLLTSAGAAVSTGEMVLELDSITAIQSDTPYPLTPRTQGWFDRYQGSNFTGAPCDYTIFGNQLRLYPIPDQEYQWILSALARLGPNPLSGDTDTNGWLTEGEVLIRQSAKHIIYRDVIRDAEGMQLALAGMTLEEASLKRKMAAKAYTGVQRAWSL